MRYPTPEEARKTFEEIDLVKAINERVGEAHQVDVFTLNAYRNEKILEFTPEMYRQWGNFVEAVQNANPFVNISFASFNLTRSETANEAEAAIITNRQQEMRYTEKSPYYGVHDLEFMESRKNSNE